MAAAPESPSSSSFKNSPAVAGRSSGSFAKARMTVARIGGGTAAPVGRASIGKG